MVIPLFFSYGFDLIWSDVEMYALFDICWGYMRTYAHTHTHTDGLIVSFCKLNHVTCIPSQLEQIHWLGSIYDFYITRCPVIQYVFLPE